MPIFAFLFGKAGSSADTRDEPPIREEIFGIERLEQYAATLALECRITEKPRRGRRLLPRLEENARQLIAAYRALGEAIRNEHSISPAAEWLVDNFHIVEEQLREIRQDLPPGFYNELPKLDSGPLAGYPRIYLIAVALIAHTDSHLDSETLKRFVRAYQKVTPLTIGELWAIAITLRLALVENLRRLALRIVAAREAREEADRVADQILQVAERSPESLAALLAGKLGKREDLDRAFVVQLTQRLRDQDPAVMPVFDWLEKHLKRRGQTTEQIVHLEHQRQAAAQVTVGNIIASMRLLSTIDWRQFFESVSLVDPVLAEDPAGVYSRMTFETRDRFRHVIERISKRTKTSEVEVAREAVRLAKSSAESDSEHYARSHVGYYIVGDGNATLENSFRYHATVGERLARRITRRPSVFYLGTLAALTVLIVTLLVGYAYHLGAGLPVVGLFGILSLVPASDLALGILNWDVSHFLKPRLLSAIDTTDGIPADAVTMVVVPTMFTSAESVDDLLDRLEVHYLANQDDNLYFALLGDFADAEKEEMPEDAALMEAAFKGIEDLNKRYQKGDEGAKRFHLFVRRRLWNEFESRWMGWERKRGKLEEFNHLLRGSRDTSFVVATARAALLNRVRYVITLDSDTQLPRDTARRLVGIALHPLNRPHYDVEKQRVTRGYGILQPRVSVTLESAARSRFARIFSGNTGIDPYTTAASDVYQDLFGEGIFTGKGIYDVEAFSRALDGRVPENCLLSHDLFEGLYARAGLVTNVELLDDYPARYDTYAKRQHRWTRGDWQIARWLMPYVRDAEGRRTRNRLPVISRWKILDNLRRSMVAPSIMLWLIFAWTMLPGSPVVWSIFILVTLAFPVYAHVTTGLMLHPRGIPWSSYFWSMWGDVLTNTAQVLLTISFIPHQAYLMTDAIVRTLYRKLFSRRRLLEWVTAAQVERASQHDLSGVFRFMLPAEIVTVAALLLIVVLHASAFLHAAWLLAIWALSPVTAYRISIPARAGDGFLTVEEIIAARLIARRTWRFFETFVGAGDHWLPPDNFQEDPRPVIAHRTSPTNIGLLLLSTLAAHDFGYLGTLEVLERLELTFDAMRQLPKFHGHFFNWYDTRTLETLSPQYVSTVDSGNLAGHLIAVKQACAEFANLKLFDQRTLNGLVDTVTLMREEANRLSTARQRTEVVTIRQLRDALDSCEKLANAPAPDTFSGWSGLMRDLNKRALLIEDIVGALAQEHGEPGFAELRFWLNALRRQTEHLIRDMDTFACDQFSGDDKLGSLGTAVSDDAAGHLNAALASVDRVAPLSELASSYTDVLSRVSAIDSEIEGSAPANGASARAALDGLSARLQTASRAITGVSARAAALATRCQSMVDEMDFRFLLDPERRVFVIGYNVSASRCDNSFYDLLASEARLASFIAIAKGNAPQEHWFRLGRQLTPVDGGRALISWTGTMFEYLMPLLVMRDYDRTLLDQTYHAVIARQIEYGAERSVPWGISEAAYNARDLNLNYQYGPFGVPGLGLKRGLSEDLVVAPYATMLAANVDPRAALENLRRLRQEGALARFGYYESIDYTPERLPQDRTSAIIRAFMAHHQGMSLVSLDNALNGHIMQRRFHLDPQVQATELLLQERIPRNIPAAHPRAEEVLSGRVVRTLTGPVSRVYDSANLPTPRTQLLSNGNYSVMMTTAGSGFSTSGKLAVTRWREDVTRDNYGSFYYLRDVRSGAVWSAGYQPVGRTPGSYEVIFSDDKVEMRRVDAGIMTQTEIIVSPEDDAEIRRISITNQSSRLREIEVTSYLETVLAPLAADIAHPAFSNLFIETEFVAPENALLARRRPRSSSDDVTWGVHVVVTEGERVGSVQFETDRSRFLGRGHTPRDPVAVIEDRPLSNTTGAVLDPIFSLRARVRIQPGETARVTFATGIAPSRDHAIALAEKYHDPSIFDREARLAWTQSQVAMRHRNISAEEAHLFQRLAGRVLYADSTLRPRPNVLALNTRAQSSLWPYGISGDLPIVLVRINKTEELETVRQMLRAHEYLRLKGLKFDLIILNDHPPTYLQELHDELQAIIRASAGQSLQDMPGGIFLRRTDLMPEADRILLHSVARVVIVAERGTLEEQLTRRPVEEELPPVFVPRAPSRTYPEPPVELPELAFFNGLGGFREGGREYVSLLGEGQWTPAPWTNVVANERDFGFLVTESGGGYTWSVNSRENRLTPWSNDAVSDPPGEVIYLRDEETGTIWTPTPLPIREAEPYIVRHGQGYTVFEHTSHGISQELLLFVPLDAPVKIVVLRLRNTTTRRRRLSATFYNELVLGVQRGAAAPYVITSIDAETGAIFARNPYNNEFAARTAFADASSDKRTITCDRREFIGRNGNPERPAALRRTQLAGRIGAGLDPCAALQVKIDLMPGEGREVIFLLGETETQEEARSVINGFRKAGAVDQAFERVVEHWDRTLEAVRVRTPDTALDTLLNRWLLYQTLACRVWARSAFYQSGGAYGFRDQLQDVMALTYSRPEIARDQILRAAAHQFKEGDVQHWWHPPTGRGIRTRFSDDLLWLPYVTSFYLNITGDRALLDEEISFVDAPMLAAGEDESYSQPVVTDEKASLYEHCVRALDRSLKVGAHGLPLMGSGDWNDGMNRVGNQGRGESVWVGWFLLSTLSQFAAFSESRGDRTRAESYRDHVEKLKEALSSAGWDGDWYRRAYFDDGTPLGSAQNEECRIDSIVQSWGILSGAAEPQHAHRAMAAVEEYLIRRGDGLVILFTPPFDHGSLDPGYIKGYVPGVRENGGQYTHAALWVLIAYAMIGDGDRAGELFALLNPVNHASTRAGLHKYKVEPYVAAGDIYAVWPHTGRGGWTWYTGSAGWMYRAGLESILGFTLVGETLRMSPCIPRGWRDFEIDYRYRSARYNIRVENPHGMSHGIAEIEVDGRVQASDDIALKDDGAQHTVRIVLGERPRESEDESEQGTETAYHEGTRA